MIKHTRRAAIQPRTPITAIHTSGIYPDITVVSGLWPDCTIRATNGSSLENFGPFANGLLVFLPSLPRVIDGRFFWGARGYAWMSERQQIDKARRILRALNSDAYVDYLYVGSEQIFVGGEPVAAIFGATL